MIHLHSLGGVRLDRDGRTVTGRAGQRHQLAVLALLAGAPGSVATRDKLIGCLWPDRGPKAGRHRLSVALHVLRSELGRGCITSRGDALRLESEMVWTDAGAFTASVAAGRLEEAVRLYVGPFLDGFFLRGAPEFERWVDVERARLAGLQAGALEQLAAEAQARGDLTAAAGWWTKLAREDPYSSRIALEVVRAIERSGDRIGALRHARAHAALVTSALGAEPDPALVDLAAYLARVGPRPPPADASGRPSPAKDIAADAPSASPAGARSGPVGAVAARTAGRRRRIRAAAVFCVGLTGAATLVGLSMATARTEDARAGSSPAVVAETFEAPGEEPGAARLAAGLGEEILATLAHVPHLTVVADSSSRASDSGAGGGSGGTTSASHVISGVVERGARHFAVTVGLRSPGTGRPPWVRRYERPVGEPEAVREELSLAIASDLRVLLVPFQPNRYTENRRAYDRFLRGVHAQRKMTPEDLWKALQFYREALEEDSAFALAHAISANAYMGLSSTGVDPGILFERARDHALRSLELDGDLAEGHAALAVIQIWWDRDFRAGERSLRRALMLYPTLPQVRSTYGDYLMLARDRPDAALRSYRRALELDPLNAARSYKIERALYLSRRYDEVIEQSRVTRSLSPDHAFTYHGSPRADALRELGRYEEAIDEYRRLHSRTGGPPPAGLGITYARMGMKHEAMEVLRAIRSEPPTSPAGRDAIASLHLALGDFDRALEWLEPRSSARSVVRPGPGADPAFDPIRSDPRFQALLSPH